MAGPAILLEIIAYIFQRTPPTADCDEPLKRKIIRKEHDEWDQSFLIGVCVCEGGVLSGGGGGVKKKYSV